MKMARQSGAIGQIKPVARRKRRGFTIMEIMVVTAIIAVLAALLLPALQGGRVRAKTTQCLNNMRQLGLAIHMYADDWNGYLPCPSDAFGASACWYYAVNPYLARAQVGSGTPPPEMRLAAIKQDPIWHDFDTLKRTNWRTIKMNKKLVGTSTDDINGSISTYVPSYRTIKSVPHPSLTPMLFDGRVETAAELAVHRRWFDGWEPYVTFRHGRRGANICFVDGRMEFWTQGTLNMPFGDGWSSTPTNNTGLIWWVQ